MGRLGQWGRVIAWAILGSVGTPAAAAASAASVDAASAEGGSTARPRVGLVLGGGGARGAAHIGVLKVLERERIPVDVVAGTSMGAIVGGLYAAGYAPDEIEAVLLAIDWKAMFDDDPPRVELPMRRKEDDLRFLLDFKLGFRDGAIQLPRGLIQGQKLFLLLRRLLLPVWSIDDFDALPIPFRAVGTDIGRGEAVVFGEGDLATAIRSSMSVPAAFAPIRVDGRLMVDGGIVNNVPVDVALGMGAERLIVVNVGEPLLPDTELNDPVAVTMQMITALMEQRTRTVLAAMDARDVLIVPPLGHFSSAAFDQAGTAIPKGVEGAEAQLDRLRGFTVGEAEYAAWKARHRRRAFDPPLVAFLEVIGNRSKSAGYVEHQLAGHTGAPLDVDALEADIGRAYGYDAYERIPWRLVEKDGSTGVEVLPVDKGWGPNYITAGLQISDNFNGASDYQLTGEITFTGLNRWGAESRNRIELGRYTGLRSEFYQPWGEIGQYFALPFAEYLAINQPISFLGTDLAEYRVQRLQAGFEAGWNLSPTLQLKGGLLRGHDRAKRRVGDVELDERVTTNFGAVTVGVLRDTLDDAEFPSAGSRFQLDLAAYREALGTDGDAETADLIWDKALSRGASRWLLGTRVHSSWGQPQILQGFGVLGGFTNLSGFGERQLVGEQSFLARAVYYRRFGDMTKLFTVPAYVGGSLETGNVWPTRDLVDLDSLIYAGSVFAGVDTPLGPLFLGYGYADTGDSSWYLSFGSLLRPPRR